MKENGPVKVGDRVRFKSGPSIINGKVIEDRGPIGINGRRLYRIRFTLDPEFTGEIEMPADKFEVISEQASAG